MSLQHDCQEFLALLLDNLHEQLNTASCKSIVSDVSTPPPTPHSQCEMLDEREPARKLCDGMDQETSTQVSHRMKNLLVLENFKHWTVS
jgi:hypothetical protein